MKKQTPPVHVRFSREQLKELKDRADAEDRPVSVMARLLVMRGLRGGPDYQGATHNPSPTPPSFSHGRGEVSIEERWERALEVTARTRKDQP